LGKNFQTLKTTKLKRKRKKKKKGKKPKKKKHYCKYKSHTPCFNLI
jgi:hypothetical protein